MRRLCAKACRRLFYFFFFVRVFSGLLWSSLSSWQYYPIPKGFFFRWWAPSPSCSSSGWVVVVVVVYKHTQGTYNLLLNSPEPGSRLSLSLRLEGKKQGNKKLWKRKHKHWWIGNDRESWTPAHTLKKKNNNNNNKRGRPRALYCIVERSPFLSSTTRFTARLF